jgi:hypothetical protein
MAGLPWIRDVGNGIINGIEGKYGKYQVTPAQAVIEKGITTAVQLSDWDDIDNVEMAMSLMQLTTMSLGLPGMQMKRTIQGAKQLSDGDTRDITRLLFPE